MLEFGHRGDACSDLGSAPHLGCFLILAKPLCLNTSSPSLSTHHRVPSRVRCRNVCKSHCVAQHPWSVDFCPHFYPQKPGLQHGYRSLNIPVYYRCRSSLWSCLHPSHAQAESHPLSLVPATPRHTDPSLPKTVRCLKEICGFTCVSLKT